MKALIIGFGSIGKRHLKNLTKFVDVHQIFVFTKRPDLTAIADASKVTFIDACKTTLVELLKQYEFDFAIIANETHKHIETAITLAQKVINLFIEKPVSHNFNRIEKLQKLIDSNNIKIFIGYNLRFLPAIQKVKKLLENQVLGKLYFARIEVGQYLPSWRPGTDYSKSYSARRCDGGGVALDLSHEVDYMHYLFGIPATWQTMKAKVSNLKIDSEDVFQGIYKYSDDFICHIHMDYLKPASVRQFSITAQKGQIACDLINKKLIINSESHQETITDTNYFEMAKTYIDELKSFINSIKDNTNEFISLSDGLTVLELLENKND